MDDCLFCNEFDLGSFVVQNQNYGSRILSESDNFLVFPALGQIVEGYLLLASKKHHIGIGQVPEILYPELESVLSKVRRVLLEAYASPLFFEHGPTSNIKKGGCCLVHAHIHAVPVQVDLLLALSKHFKYEKIKSLKALKEQFNKGVPYYFYESNIGERYLFEVPEIVPSQYIRRVIAAEIGKPERWDWRNYYGIEELLNTRGRLKNKF